MSNFETSEVLYPSEEVTAYPLVLKLCAINWVALAAENPDDERVAGFGLAAAFCDTLAEELSECRAIAKASAMPEDCTRWHETSAPFLRPREF